MLLAVVHHLHVTIQKEGLRPLLYLHLAGGPFDVGYCLSSLL